jgi:hypothetical protein
MEPTSYNKAHNSIDDAARFMLQHNGKFIGTDFEDRAVQITKDKLKHLVEVFVDTNLARIKEEK